MATPKFYHEKRSGNIVLKYSFLGQRLEYYTGVCVDEKYYNKAYWKSTSKRPIKTIAVDSDKMNRDLKDIVDHLHTAESEARAAGMTLTVKYFRDYLNNKLKSKPKAITPQEEEQKPDGFIQYFDHFVEAMKTSTNKKTGHPLSVVTPRRYGSVAEMLKDFELHRGRPLQWADFDETLFNELITYQSKRYSVNTIGRNTRAIKTVLSKAMQAGYPVNPKFAGAFRSASEEVDNAYLTEEELTKLLNHDFKGKLYLDRVRDLFLVGCWTGLRFSDFTNIRPENINNGMIRIIAQKTKKPVTIPLHPVVVSIMEKYNYLLPPAISNQKFNVYIRECCKDAKIEAQYTKTFTREGKSQVKKGAKHEFISSHSARRSFASNAFKRGIPATLIMAITGHKTETEFMRYIKVTAEQKAEMFKQLAQW